MNNSLILDKECLETARKQFCLDIGLSWQEYCENRERTSFVCKNKSGAVNNKDAWENAQKQEGARIYAGRSNFFRAIICLGQLFICCDEKIYDWVVEQYEKCLPEWFCDFQNLRKLDEKLKEFGYQIQDTHVYFLPEKRTAANRPVKQSQMCEEMQDAEWKEDFEGLETGQYVWFEQEEILRFKENNRFTSAICFWEGTSDVLAVAKLKRGPDTISSGEKIHCVKPDELCIAKDFDQSHMLGMAGASCDGKYLWQIGINVDKEYAGQGLGHELVRTLKEEIQRRGKVPFYGTSESHTVSQTVGLKAGFVPAWTEVFASELNL